MPGPARQRRMSLGVFWSASFVTQLEGQNGFFASKWTGRRCALLAVDSFVAGGYTSTGNRHGGRHGGRPTLRADWGEDGVRLAFLPPVSHLLGLASSAQSFPAPGFPLGLQIHLRSRRRLANRRLDPTRRYTGPRWRLWLRSGRRWIKSGGGGGGLMRADMSGGGGGGLMRTRLLLSPRLILADAATPLPSPQRRLRLDASTPSGG